MTLKDILDAVLLESGMGTETAYAANGNDDIKRLVSIANRSVVTLAKFEWQALRQIYTFMLTTDTEYDLPEDFAALTPDTAFADDYISPVDMRTNPSQWAYLHARSGGNGARYRFRILGDKIQVHEPQDGATIRFEYLTDRPVLSVDGEAKKSRFTADTDTWLLDDDLLTMDIIWRYKKLLGLPDWGVDRDDYLNYSRTIKGQQAGAKAISPDDGMFGFSEPYYDLWRPVE